MGRLAFALLLASSWLGASPALALRLCMLEAQLPFPADDERRAQLERVVTQRFEAASVEIAPSAEVAALLERIDERSGAIFDPATGHVDTAQDTRFREDIERSLREAFDCAGLVELSLAKVIARYDGTWANWDGQRVRINSGGRIAARLLTSAVLGAYISEEGWVPALSLWIRVVDFQRRDVAFRSAGIEPLMDFSYARGKDLLPEDRWLRDDERVAEAVDSALGPGLSALKADTQPVDAADEKAFRWE